MKTLLFLSHRFPYPPDRGEKIRAWHLLRHLSRSHRVFLGCLIDDEQDWQYRPRLEAICEEVGCFAISKRRQKLRAMARIRPGRPLMLDYYDHPGLHRWIARVAANQAIDLAYVFSTAMTPYALEVAAPRRVLDMVDVDSEKWADYARKGGWPMRAVWAREARTLGTYERHAAMVCDRTLLVTEAECRRFAELAPASRDRIATLENGVDLDYFAPAAPAPAVTYQDPYPAAGAWLALVGNMDYWPNADAAAWLTREILALLGHTPQGSLAPKVALVGANPGIELRRLAAPDVLVTGRVPDVRPYLAHAAVVVAPLRIARGLQNKVLEGMAMARPVVASPEAFEGIRAEPGRDLLVADGAEAFARGVADILRGHHPGLGEAARRAVERNYSWVTQLQQLDRILADTAASPARSSS